MSLPSIMADTTSTQKSAIVTLKAIGLTNRKVAKKENAELKEENIQLQAKVKRMEISMAKVRGELLDLL